MNWSFLLIFFVAVTFVRAFQQTSLPSAKLKYDRHPSAPWRPSPIQASGEDSTEELAVDSSKTTARSLGFDAPTSSSISEISASGDIQNDRLRKSLDESAKFKIRNDARFTWLSTLLVSGAYAYGCLAPDGQEFLDILGIPNGGIAGGIGGIAFSLASILLFFAPELFASNRK